MSKRTACGATAVSFQCASSATLAAPPPSSCADPRSQPCRVTAGPAPTTCAGGLEFSLAEAPVTGASTPGARLVAPTDASFYITEPLTARGSAGRCSYAAPSGGGAQAAAALPVVRAPATPVGAVDLCVCAPTTITFQSTDERLTSSSNPTPLLTTPLCAPGKSVKKTVSLPLARAVDDCGRELPMTVEIDGAPSKKPGDAIDLQALPCGTYTVTYRASLPAGDVLAAKDFTFEVQCADGSGVAGVEDASGVPCT